MTPHSPVPFGSYPLDLNIFKACPGEPLQHIKFMFLFPESCTMIRPISEGIEACVVVEAFLLIGQGSNTYALKRTHLQSQVTCQGDRDTVSGTVRTHSCTLVMHNVQSILC